MKFFDFLFYYLTCWFTKRAKVFKKMVPIDRVTYVMGISTLLWIMCIDMIVEYFIFGSFKSIVPKYIFIISAFFFMWLFKYIYITKKRYERIFEINQYKFNVSEKIGITISIVFVFLSLLIPFAIATILYVMNGMPLYFSIGNR